jgi:isopenicillin N synthase-like dioxygenase
MTERAIPIIDFSGVREGDASALSRVAQEIHAACMDYGFFYLSHHGIPGDAIDGAVAAAATFFALDADEKNKSVAIDHRGYVGMGDAKMQGATRTDHKESYVIGLELPVDDPTVLAGEKLRGPNRWPSNPAFRQAIDRYYAEVGKCGADLLRAVAVSLGQSKHFFADKYDKPLQRLNIIHYPPHPVDAAVDQFGGAAHTDYGCITLLWQDQNGGLQVQDRTTKQWLEAKPVPGTIVINVGDLLERWSNKRYMSMPHRVVNKSGRERYSMATFFDPDFSTIADPRAFGISDEASLFPPITAGDHILGRVQASFAYRPDEPVAAA